VKSLYGILLSILLLVATTVASSHIHAHEEGHEAECTYCFGGSDLEDELFQSKCTDLEISMIQSLNVILYLNLTTYKKNLFIFQLSARGPPQIV